MNILHDFIKNFYLNRLIKARIITKEGNRYYSNCAMREEVTIEIKEIFEED